MWEKFTTKHMVDTGEWRRVGEFPTPWPCFSIAATDAALAQREEVEEVRAEAKQREDDEREARRLEKVLRDEAYAEYVEERLRDQEARAAQAAARGGGAAGGAALVGTGDDAACALRDASWGVARRAPRLRSHGHHAAIILVITVCMRSYGTGSLP